MFLTAGVNASGVSAAAAAGGGLRMAIGSSPGAQRTRRSRFGAQRGSVVAASVKSDEEELKKESESEGEGESESGKSSSAGGR